MASARSRHRTGTVSSSAMRSSAPTCPANASRHPACARSRIRAAFTLSESPGSARSAFRTPGAPSDPAPRTRATSSPGNGPGARSAPGRFPDPPPDQQPSRRDPCSPVPSTAPWGREGRFVNQLPRLPRLGPGRMSVGHRPAMVPDEEMREQERLHILRLRRSKARWQVRRTRGGPNRPWVWASLRAAAEVALDQSTSSPNSCGSRPKRVG